MEFNWSNWLFIKWSINRWRYWFLT